MRVLTAAEMARFDRWAIEEASVPGPVLMENAALGVVDALAASYPEAEDVLVVCGPGNNGGDGLAVHRHLSTRGYRSRARLVTVVESLRGDAALQLAICRQLGLAVEPWRAEELMVEPPDLIVDALFGTGLSRPLEGSLAELATRLGERGSPVVAVDLPSGLDASSARPIGPHVRADLTVTFARPKVAHVLAPACEACGEVLIADLGVPWIDLDGDEPHLALLRAEELSGYLQPRAAAAHKGDFGHAAIVAGSVGYSGAAVLAARAAVRAGAGLVTSVVPAAIRIECECGSLESMTAAIGMPAAEALRLADLEAVLERLAGKSAVAIGPGLGQLPETRALVHALLERIEVPVILDADGCNAFAGEVERLARRSGELVLTPHPGELGRLLGQSAAEVQADRLAAVRQASAATGAVVALKGSRTLIAEPGGNVWVNPTGNPGMASGGTGDVLTGVIVSLVAQGYDLLAATQLGVFWHGAAGDLAAETTGFEGLTAGHLVETLASALERLGRER